MEEIEVPTEHLQEEMHHHAEHARERWVSRVALSSAILAALAAVSAMLSGHHANEAMIDQIHASDKWAYYQAKSIKASLLSTKRELLAAQGKKAEAEAGDADGGGADSDKAEKYAKQQEEISAEARAEEASSKAHLLRHETLARAVTLFQIGIAIGAIAALTKRRKYWWVSMAAGAAGIGFLVAGLI